MLVLSGSLKHWLTVHISCWDWLWDFEIHWLGQLAWWGIFTIITLRKHNHKYIWSCYKGKGKGNGKVVPVLLQSTMPWRRIGEWRYSSTHSLTSALDGGKWSASRPSRFTPKERAPGTHWIGGWVGPRAVLDAVVKRKIPSPRRKSNPRTLIVEPVAQRYTDWAITAPHEAAIRSNKCILVQNTSVGTRVAQSA
jgi:hypothetical protein